jgi:hypothetical protein
MRRMVYGMGKPYGYQGLNKLGCNQKKRVERKSCGHKIFTVDIQIL